VPRVLMYCTEICPYCVMADRLLRAKGVLEIEKVRVDLQPELRIAMMEQTGLRTVPQIYIGTRHIGGYDELAALEHSGELTKLLS
jgi:glutaredoxin 3